MDAFIVQKTILVVMNHVEDMFLKHTTQELCDDLSCTIKKRYGPGIIRSHCNISFWGESNEGVVDTL